MVQSQKLDSDQVSAAVLSQKESYTSVKKDSNLDSMLNSVSIIDNVAS